MADSEIEWTDKVWNPVRGCTKVSPGCAHCYAETFAERFRGVKGHPYEQGFDLRLVPEKLAEPLTWKKPRRVFVNSMSDLFQDAVPDAFIDQVFAVMALAPQHTFQVLTKRSERMRDYMRDPARHHAVTMSMQDQEHGMARLIPANGRSYPRWPNEWPLPNVWLGVSVENQHFADERIPLLLQTPASVRFISAEPLLSHVDLSKFLWTIPDARLNRLHWVIVGGESGYGAKEFDLEWARWLVAQGKSADVPVFVKQVGAQPYDSSLTESGRSEGLTLKSRKGGDMAEWPEDLRVRQFPSSLLIPSTEAP